MASTFHHPRVSAVHLSAPSIRPRNLTMRNFSLPKPQPAISLVTEIQFGIKLEFRAPPVAASHPWPGVSDRERNLYYFALALQRAGLQAAFLLDKQDEAKEDEAEDEGEQATPGKDSIRKDSENEDAPEAEGSQLPQMPSKYIVKTKHNPDMFVMNPQSSTPWINAGAKDNPLLRYWLLKAGTENTAEVQRQGVHLNWQPMELSSPMLRESEANNLFPGINTAVYEIWIAHPAKLNTHIACGLHVEVGPAVVPSLGIMASLSQGLTQGLQRQHRGSTNREVQPPRPTLTTLQAQRVATLVVVLEDKLLFHLCHPSRRQVYHQLATGSGLAHAPNTPACQPAQANLPPNVLAGSGPVERAIKHLWTATDTDQVQQLLSLLHPRARDKSRTTALHITSHAHEDGGVTHALEFRHAQATFSQSFVDNWTRLALTICKAAFLPTERFKLLVAML
ncbi:uncharacterized protein TRIREDRAFT_102904 [Trichoderma reesei QM6a]|uniref:Predicted protein n=1 Tax=Hypocrea jecorina (strain QM6a) TaxID=431241 RepID=G0R8L5_HYPJQ|nr:uncharacterized protein TRIREDRAFT_102904 [Trichoderma reesei QM6a]EGR52370.1 predicted protein [Trichoderma reesei QM6a]